MVTYYSLLTSLFLSSASPGQASIHHLFTWFLIVASLVFISVTGIVLYVCYRYRAKNQDERPVQSFGNTKVEVSLTLLTSCVVGVFLYMTITTMFDIQKPAGKQTADVVITAHQWWWQVEYPKSSAVTANEIHIPVGKRVLFKFKSADVVHDFWVPELGRKMDIIPGDTTHLWIQANKAREYTGACSEFCGAQHAWMRIHVIAEPQKQFNQWAEKNARPAEQPQKGIAAEGAKLFHRLTCGNCHSIRGTSADGTIGPDLTHLGNRKTLLTGLLQNNKANLRRWLEDPQKIKKGAHMPRFILEDKQVNKLVTYLEGLK